MKTVINYLRTAIIAAMLFFAVNASAQDLARQLPKEPKINLNVKSTSNADINNFVAQCFAMYNNMKELSQKVQTIQNSIISGSTNGSLATGIADLNDAMNGFQNIKSNGPALVTSVTNIIANIKEYPVKVLEIPRTLLNLREALKAIKYAVESSISTLAIIPDLKRKITGGNTVSAEQQPVPVQEKTATAITEQKEKITTSTITLKGISFLKLQQLEDTLKICPLMKSMNKKFGAGLATLDITHTGNLGELWKFIAAHCKDTANEEMITAWDETNSRIDIAM